MSVMMSDVETTTFTLRDLNRRLAEVIETCDRLGSVQIRARNGKTYALTAAGGRLQSGPLPDFAARRRALGIKPLSKAQAAALDRLIAGE